MKQESQDKGQDNDNRCIMSSKAKTMAIKAMALWGRETKTKAKMRTTNVMRSQVWAVRPGQRQDLL